MNLINILKHDLYRYCGNLKLKIFFKYYILSPGFHYVFWFRVASKYPNFLTKWILHSKMIKFEIEIHPNIKIGKGLYIGHLGDCDKS